MERHIKLSLIAIYSLGLLDSVINTVVAPSLIFYILSVGGTKEDYGLTTSAVCMGMTIMVFFFGKWIDSNGNRYHAPFACTFILGIAGSLIYFLAILLPKGTWAVNAILVGRFVQGMGAAGKTLLSSWIATAIPFEEQKTIITIHTMVGMAGTFIGPALNTLVAEIDTSITILGTYIPINPYNSIGLLVAANEAILWVVTILLLTDPPPQQKPLTAASNDESTTKEEEQHLLKALTYFDIVFPVIQQFVLVFNFILLGVAMSPVAADLLGWTPVGISYLCTAQSGVVFVGMAATLYLSVKEVPDFTFIFFGNAIFVVGGALTYILWRADTATVVTFALPFLLITFAFPFTGPSNQSSFNKAVFSKPELASSIGVLQSVYTQGGTIAGIVAPPFTTGLVLRDTKDVTSSEPHELTTWAYFIPISALLMIVGLLYEEFILGKNELGLLSSKSEAVVEEEEDVTPDETSKLVPADKRGKSKRASIVEINQVFSRKYEVERAMSSEVPINGYGIVNPVETAYERKLMKELSRGRSEWEHLLKLDQDMDGMEMNE